MGRVALIGENSIGYINALVDIWNNGDCAVLLDWRIPFSAVIEMMIEADVHTCFIEKGLYNKIDREIPISFDFVTYEKQNNAAEILPNFIYKKFQENYSRNEAVVIYSSGTTGKSKGIILSHFAINTNADAIIDYMKPTINDCIYIAKTLSHSSTLTGELLVALKTKIKLVVAPTIVPPRYVLNNVGVFGVTIVCLNPTLISMLADEYEKSQYDISSLRTIYVSGSILNDKIYEKAHAVFSHVPIYNVYGLSEAGPRVTAQRLDCSKSNSVGKPIKDIEIKVVNEQGSIVSDGEYGIIHVKTPSLFDGYVIGRNKLNSLYKGWHNTGDVGYFDIYGELHIINRLDDVIIINSHKVYPSEIERQIVEQTNVKECVARLYKIICDHYEKRFKNTFSEDVEHCIRFILSRNIVCGNALDMKDYKGDPIRFSEWKNPSNGWINRKEYMFEDLMEKGDAALPISDNDIPYYIPKETKDFGNIDYRRVFEYAKQE